MVGGSREDDARALAELSANHTIRHAILGPGTWNSNLCYLKWEEDFQPIQTDGLALVSRVGGVYMWPFPAAPVAPAPAQCEPRAWGLSGLRPRRLGEARAGCEKVAREEE